MAPIASDSRVATLLGALIAVLLVAAVSYAATVTQVANGTQGDVGKALVDKTTSKVYCSQTPGATLHLPGNPDAGVPLAGCPEVTTTAQDYCTNGPNGLVCLDSRGHVPGALHGVGLQDHMVIWGPGSELLPAMPRYVYGGSTAYFYANDKIQSMQFYISALDGSGIEELHLADTVDAYTGFGGLKLRLYNSDMHGVLSNGNGTLYLQSDGGNTTVLLNRAGSVNVGGYTGATSPFSVGAASEAMSVSSAGRVRAANNLQVAGPFLSASGVQSTSTSTATATATLTRTVTVTNTYVWTSTATDADGGIMTVTTTHNSTGTETYVGTVTTTTTSATTGTGTVVRVLEGADATISVATGTTSSTVARGDDGMTAGLAGLTQNVLPKKGASGLTDSSASEADGTNFAISKPLRLTYGGEAYPTQMTLYPAVANRRAFFRLIPNGSPNAGYAVSGVQFFNTDFLADSTNYEFGQFAYVNNVLTLYSGQAGTGVARDVKIYTASGANLNVQGAAGVLSLNDSLYSRTDGTLVLGSSSAQGSVVSTIYAANVNNPTLGQYGGTFAILNGSGGVGKYGTLFGQKGTGDGFIQVQRTDNQAIAYNLLLQPVGGALGIGVGASVTAGTIDSALPLRLRGSSSGASILRSPATANLDATLPSADGSADQCLKTNGSGVWGWKTCGAGSVGGSGTAGNLMAWATPTTAGNAPATYSGNNITLPNGGLTVKGLGNVAGANQAEIGFSSGLLRLDSYGADAAHYGGFQFVAYNSVGSPYAFGWSPTSYATDKSVLRTDGVGTLYLGALSAADVGAMASPSLTTNHIPYWDGSTFQSGTVRRNTSADVMIGEGHGLHSAGDGNSAVHGFGFAPGYNKVTVAGKPASLRWTASTGEFALQMDSTTRAVGDTPALGSVLSCTGAGGCTLTGHATGDLPTDSVRSNFYVGPAEGVGTGGDTNWHEVISVSVTSAASSGTQQLLAWATGTMVFGSARTCYAALFLDGTAVGNMISRQATMDGMSAADVRLPFAVNSRSGVSGSGATHTVYLQIKSSTSVSDCQMQASDADLLVQIVPG